MKPKFFKVETTKYWHESIVKQAGKLYDVFCFDDSEQTYCCELTPSFACEFVDTVTKNKVDDETYEDIVYNQGYPDDFQYFHVSDVESNKSLTDASEYGDFDTLDDAIEYYRGNPWY